MNKNIFAILAFLAALLLGACSEGTEEVVAGYNKDGIKYSPNSLNFTVSMYENLDAVQIKVIQLDYGYDPVDTVSAGRDENDDESRFVTDTLEFPSPYVKVLLSIDGDVKMDFEYYMDIARSSRKRLNLVEAIAVDRIEHLMFDKKKSLYVAVDSAVDEVQNAFDSKASNDPVFLYCRFEPSDSVFYGDFIELKKSFALEPEIPHEFLVRTADDLLKHFNGLEWTGTRRAGSDEWREDAFRLVKEAYSLGAAGKGNITTIKDSHSEFRGDTLVCDQFAGRDGMIWVWHRVSDDEEKSGDTVSVDSVLFECDGKQCETVTIEDHYKEGCNEGKTGQMLKLPKASTMEYFICAFDSTKDVYAWDTLKVWEYYGDVCNDSSYLKVTQRDGLSYLCQKDGTMKILKEDQLIPPVLNMDTCDVGNELVKYDDVYYVCDKNSMTWRKAESVDLSPPALQGLYCNGKNYREVLKLDDKYYYCYSYGWGEASIADVENFLMKQKNKDYCANGLVGTSILLTDSLKRSYGCRTNVNGPDTIGTYGFFYGTYDSRLAGGIFTEDTLYQVKINNFTYVFTMPSGGFLYPSKVYDGEVLPENYKYDAFSNDNVLYLHSKRSENNVALETIENKSESFDAFYFNWLGKVRKSIVCNGTLVTVSLASAETMWYTDDSYMTWEQARNYCPKGYHIPDTSEWNSTAGLKYKATALNREYRNDTPLKLTYDVIGKWYDCSYYPTRYYDIFWSSTEKDSESQYCLEYGWTSVKGELSRRIISCPKDLYPMVQTMCVED